MYSLFAVLTTVGFLGFETNAFVTFSHYHNHHPYDRSLLQKQRIVTSPYVFLSKTVREAKKSDGEETGHALAVGTFVEFEEKKNRSHVGKILKLDHKSSGGVRYTVESSTGQTLQIASKAILYSVPCPNSPGQASKLFSDFEGIHDASQHQLENELNISPELLQMAWEEVAEMEDGDHTLTPGIFFELIHSKAASAIEKYAAWKLLRTQMAHIFFREIKDHGLVVAFKAKARKAVDAAKIAFCKTHIDDNEICFV